MTSIDTRTPQALMGELLLLAEEESLDGDWSEETANLRCARYAELVTSLLGGVDADPAASRALSDRSTLAPGIASARAQRSLGINK